MKVTVFIDRSTISSQFSVNCIYRLNGYRNPLKPQSSYSLDFNRSLYLVGGRASIAEFCRENPFRLTSTHTDTFDQNKFTMRMTRGVPGISEAERKKLGLEKESFFSNAMGIFKKKMLTVVQILHGNAVSKEELALGTASSTSIPEAMQLHEATAMQGILAYSSGTDDLLRKAIDTREKHNRFHLHR